VVATKKCYIPPDFLTWARSLNERNNFRPPQRNFETINDFEGLKTIASATEVEESIGFLDDTIVHDISIPSSVPVAGSSGRFAVRIVLGIIILSGLLKFCSYFGDQGLTKYNVSYYDELLKEEEEV